MVASVLVSLVGAAIVCGGGLIGSALIIFRRNSPPLRARHVAPHIAVAITLYITIWTTLINLFRPQISCPAFVLSIAPAVHMLMTIHFFQLLRVTVLRLSVDLDQTKPTQAPLHHVSSNNRVQSQGIHPPFSASHYYSNERYSPPIIMLLQSAKKRILGMMHLIVSSSAIPFLVSLLAGFLEFGYLWVMFNWIDGWNHQNSSCYFSKYFVVPETLFIFLFFALNILCIPSIFSKSSWKVFGYSAELFLVPFFASMTVVFVVLGHLGAIFDIFRQFLQFVPLSIFLWTVPAMMLLATDVFAPLISSIYVDLTRKKPTVVAQDPLSDIDILLDNHETRTVFQQFCQSEWAVEYLLFYVQVRAFEKMKPRTEKKFLMAMTIVQSFIMEGSLYELNLPADKREGVLRRLPSSERNTILSEQQMRRHQYAKLPDDLFADLTQTVVRPTLLSLFSRFRMVSCAYVKLKQTANLQIEVLNGTNII